MKTDKVNRVEIIDHTDGPEDSRGRVYVKWEKQLKVEVQLQDNEKTLKIFITNPNNRTYDK